jgi:hypothetical protein
MLQWHSTSAVELCDGARWVRQQALCPGRESKTVLCLCVEYEAAVSVFPSATCDTHADNHVTFCKTRVYKALTEYWCGLYNAFLKLLFKTQHYVFDMVMFL